MNVIPIQKILKKISVIYKFVKIGLSSSRNIWRQNLSDKIFMDIYNRKIVVASSSFSISNQSTTISLISPMFSLTKEDWIIKQKQNKTNNICKDIVPAAFCINPKKAGGQFDNPCGFPKMHLPKLTSFRKISLKFLKSLRWYVIFCVSISYFRRFQSIFRIFWHFFVTKKLITSAYNRWCQHLFFTFIIL